MKRFWVTVLIILGILFIAGAIYYWVTPAGKLPSFVPGHVVGATYKHHKHGIASAIVGIVCFVGAWFVSGLKETTAPTSESE